MAVKQHQLGTSVYFRCSQVHYPERIQIKSELLGPLKPAETLNTLGLGSGMLVFIEKTLWSSSLMLQWFSSSLRYLTELGPVYDDSALCYTCSCSVRWPCSFYGLFWQQLSNCDVCLKKTLGEFYISNRETRCSLVTWKIQFNCDNYWNVMTNKSSTM